MGIFLDRNATWSIGDRTVLAGREALTVFWSRLLPRYACVRVELRRLVIDGETRIADQVHIFRREGSEPFLLENTALYQVRDAKIASWTDHVDFTRAPPEETRAWRTLRDVARAY